MCRLWYNHSRDLIASAVDQTAEASNEELRPLAYAGPVDSVGLANKNAHEQKAIPFVGERPYLSGGVNWNHTASRPPVVIRTTA